MLRQIAEERIATAVRDLESGKAHTQFEMLHAGYTITADDQRQEQNIIQSSVHGFTEAKC